jgi:hypothetical protein
VINLKHIYDRVGTVPAGLVLPLIGTKEGIVLLGHTVGVNSLRMLTFKKNLDCVKCGIVGTHFAVERDKKSAPKNYVDPDKGYHLNLYALNERGEDVLMTKDHIVPRSMGGPNTLRNLRTACARCNNKKGNHIEKDHHVDGVEFSREKLADWFLDSLSFAPNEFMDIPAIDVRVLCATIMKLRRENSHLQDEVDGLEKSVKAKLALVESLTKLSS